MLDDGKLDKGCKRGFPTPFNSLCYFLKLDLIFPNSKLIGGYHQTFLKDYDVHEIDCVSGAFFLIKKDVFRLINGFDEQFFMYAEDVDLCFRLKKLGFKNFYYGLKKVKHLKAQHRAKDLKIVKCFYDGIELFYSLHYQKQYCFLVNFLVKFGIKVMFFIAKIKFKIRNLIK